MPTAYPWALWWHVLHALHTSLYPQTCQQGKEVSDASCNAKTAILWNRRSFLCSCATSWIKHWNRALQMRRSVDFWYHQISQSYVVGNVKYTVTTDVSCTLGIAYIEVTTLSPTSSNCSGWYWCRFLIPPANCTAALAALVANCFTEALLSVHFFAVCFVLAIMKVLLF